MNLKPIASLALIALISASSSAFAMQFSKIRFECWTEGCKLLEGNSGTLAPMTEQAADTLKSLMNSDAKVYECDAKAFGVIADRGVALSQIFEIKNCSQLR